MKFPTAFVLNIIKNKMCLNQYPKALSTGNLAIWRNIKTSARVISEKKQQHGSVSKICTNSTDSLKN